MGSNSGSRVQFVAKIYHLKCSECGENVVVGHTSRDNWMGICRCTTKSLPKIQPDIDLENNHADFTGEIEWPVESWERVDRAVYTPDNDP